jgi:hypothetical protein
MLKVADLQTRRFSAQRLRCSHVVKEAVLQLGEERATNQ